MDTPSSAPAHVSTTPDKAYFTQESDYSYAGIHLLLEFWQAKHLDDIAVARQALIDAVEAAEATLLDISLHRFSPYGGFSGVAVLSESHISIHTWPELGYAAIDIFTCGNAKPHKAIPVLKAAFEPAGVQLVEHRRGMML